MPDGRLIYSQPEPPPNQNDDNLWEIRVHPRTGIPAGKPHRITKWVDSHFWEFSATRDGKRLAFLKGNSQSDVYVGEFEAKGRHLKPPRRLTLDQRQDFPGGWARDSKAVLFESDRTGSFNIFKQALDQDSAEPLTTGPESKSIPRLSPDGSWILYSVLVPGNKESLSSLQRLMRMPVGGGPSQLVLEARGIDDYHCAPAPAALCVLGERSADGKQILLTSFDPVGGRGHQVGKIEARMGPGTVSWDLSPDGSRIAFTEFGEREGHIHFLSLTGGTIPDLLVRGWPGFMLMTPTPPVAALAWAPDGKGMFVTSLSPIATTILYTDLQGHAYPLWEQQGSFASWCVPSPDNRYLAITKTDWDSNVWMLENF
jgi:Tol biopolymer transport system component